MKRLNLSVVALLGSLLLLGCSETELEKETKRYSKENEELKVLNSKSQAQLEQLQMKHSLKEQAMLKSVSSELESELQKANNIKEQLKLEFTEKENESLTSEVKTKAINSLLIKLIGSIVILICLIWFARTLTKNKASKMKVAIDDKQYKKLFESENTYIEKVQKISLELHSLEEELDLAKQQYQIIEDCIVGESLEGQIVDKLSKDIRLNTKE